MSSHSEVARPRPMLASADRDAVDRCGRLEPGRDVQRVAGREALAGVGVEVGPDERLARADPDRTWTPRSEAPRSSISRSAARMARSGSSSCAAGTPNTPTTASPMNFSTPPPYAWMRGLRSRGRRGGAGRLLGIEPSASSVDPDESQNSAVMTLRSSRAVTVPSCDVARLRRTGHRHGSRGRTTDTAPCPHPTSGSRRAARPDRPRGARRLSPRAGAGSTREPRPMPAPPR